MSKCSTVCFCQFVFVSCSVILNVFFFFPYHINYCSLYVSHNGFSIQSYKVCEYVILLVAMNPQYWTERRSSMTVWANSSWLFLLMKVMCILKVLLVGQSVQFIVVLCSWALFWLTTCSDQAAISVLTWKSCSYFKMFTYCELTKHYGLLFSVLC